MNTLVSHPNVKEKDLIYRGLYAPAWFMDILRDRTQIEKIIGQFVRLKKRRSVDEYIGHCPFHHEKTPSFTVVPKKCFFHCFGCGAHGTAIEFLKRHNWWNFHKTIKYLARKVGLPIMYAHFYKEKYFEELEIWEDRLDEACKLKVDQDKDEIGMYGENEVRYYRSCVSAIMEAQEKRYAKFHWKSYSEVTGLSMGYPKEIQDILDRDREDRESEMEL